MSFTDDDAQPQAGQDVTDSPYAQYLENIPEEARGAATEAFKQWDGDVTRRFQEASEFRKSWEPYQEAGISQYPAETVKWALETLQNPQQAREWLDQQYGPAQQPEPAQEFDYANAYQDPQQQFEKLLEQKLTPLQQRLEQYDSRWQEQEQSQRLEQANQYLQNQLDELEQKHGDEFNRGMVEQIAQKYTDDPYNAIPKAWDEWQKTVAAIEKRTLQPKLDAPGPAEGGGVADMNREKIASLNDPQLKERALQYLRPVQ